MCSSTCVASREGQNDLQHKCFSKFRLDVQADEAALDDSCTAADMLASGEDGPSLADCSADAMPPLSVRRRRSSLTRFGSRGSTTTEADGDGR